MNWDFLDTDSDEELLCLEPEPSANCQRNKASTSMHMQQGRAAVRKRRGCPETKGGHASLMMH